MDHTNVCSRYLWHVHDHEKNSFIFHKINLSHLKGNLKSPYFVADISIQYVTTNLFHSLLLEKVSITYIYTKEQLYVHNKFTMCTNKSGCDVIGRRGVFRRTSSVWDPTCLCGMERALLMWIQELDHKPLGILEEISFLNGIRELEELFCYRVVKLIVKIWVILYAHDSRFFLLMYIYFVIYLLEI